MNNDKLMRFLATDGVVVANTEEPSAAPIYEEFFTKRERGYNDKNDYNKVRNNVAHDHIEDLKWKLIESVRNKKLVAYEGCVIYWNNVEVYLNEYWEDWNDEGLLKEIESDPIRSRYWAGSLRKGAIFGIFGIFGVICESLKESTFTEKTERAVGMYFSCLTYIFEMLRTNSRPFFYNDSKAVLRVNDFCFRLKWKENLETQSKSCITYPIAGIVLKIKMHVPHISYDLFLEIIKNFFEKHRCDVEEKIGKPLKNSSRKRKAISSPEHERIFYSKMANILALLQAPFLEQKTIGQLLKLYLPFLSGGPIWVISSYVQDKEDEKLTQLFFDNPIVRGESVCNPMKRSQGLNSEIQVTELRT